MNKQYSSIFVPETKIDIENYITEVIIVNFLNWQKQPIPKSPFWRADISNNNHGLDELRKRYIAELTGVKKLMKVFNPAVIMAYFQTSKMVGYTMVRAETKTKIIMELFNRQLKYADSLDKIVDVPIETTVFTNTGKSIRTSKMGM